MFKNDRLTKLFTDIYGFNKEKERTIDFLMNSYIPHIPKIFSKKIEKNNFVGYTMEFIKDAYTFKEAINENFSYDKKINAINDIYQALKIFHHNNIFIGDIHLDNLLISKNGHGYIVDLEEIRFPGDEYKFSQYYLIKPNSNSYCINVPSKYTDNIKIMISALSLLLNINLEEELFNSYDHAINLEDILKHYLIKLDDERLISYVGSLINQESVPYFSDYYFDGSKKR